MAKRKRFMGALLVGLTVVVACGREREDPLATTRRTIMDRAQDVGVRGRALESLLEARPVTRARVDFVRALLVSDDDPVLRVWAGEAALEWEREALPLVDAFVSNLRDANSAVRVSAVSALALIGSREDHVLGEIQRLVAAESNLSVLAAALHTLGMLAASDTQRVLADHLNHEAAAVRAAAADALANLDQGNEYTIDQLLRASRDEIPAVRESVHKALVGLEPTGLQSRQVFIEAVDDESSRVRFWAAYGLGNLNPSERPEQVVHALVKLLDGDPDDDVQRAAAAALATYGAHAREAIGALERARSRGVQNSSTSLMIIREALAEGKGE